MKVIVGITRIFVGVLFIISGLIKLNDPVGFSFKLQDYFAPEVLNLEFLVPFSLMIAVVVVIFEVLLGVMIIVGYAKKFTLYSLLTMIVFFTFLTFYSAYFNKVTDCGCFGDALKLTPWESFWKDIVLLVLILFLFFGRKYIQPFFSKNVRSILVALTMVLCLWLGYHVLMHLPVVDFRPYKIGANITEGMTVPEDAPPPIIEYLWKYEIDGKEKVIANTTGQDPQPAGGTRIGVETQFLREPYEPPIHDFAIERNDEDYTEEFLAADNVIVVIAYNLDNTEAEGYAAVKRVTNEALKKGYKVIGLSASNTAETEALTERNGLNFKFYFCDMTALKTIVRSNPGILELQNGTIMQKLHWNDADNLQLETLETAMPKLNFEVKQELSKILKLDQGIRQLFQASSDEERQQIAEANGIPVLEEFKDYFPLSREIDSTNMMKISKIIDEHGYPGKSMVGTKESEAAFFVIQHSNQIPKYLDLVKKAAADGELKPSLVAMMEDRYLMYEGRAQIYGTQGRNYTLADGELLSIVWPVEDLENINRRRAEAGFIDTFEESVKRLFGDDFVFKNYTLEEANALKND